MAADPSAEATEEPPVYLYKYLSLDRVRVPGKDNRGSSPRDRARRLFATNEVWFSAPSAFNDPFDCGTKVWLPKVGLASRDWADEVGVLSLSARSDDLLMWAHYAASHKGICLRFKTVRGANPFRAASRVRYVKQVPVIFPFLDTMDVQIDKGFLMKSDCWKYEQEWRVIAHPGSPVAEGPGLVPFVPDALDGIILGARTTNADAAEVMRWVRKRRIEILRARPSDDRFEVEVAPL